MDVEALKKRLKKAQLILGLVENTVPRFIDSGAAPVAFVSIDLDYYSSTMQALKILEADQPCFCQESTVTLMISWVLHFQSIMASV